MENKQFSIVADIEAKAMLAAITDFEKTEICVTGTGKDILHLLTQIIFSVSEQIAGISEEDSREEKFEKSAKFNADLMKLMGAYYTIKYTEEGEE